MLGNRMSSLFWALQVGGWLAFGVAMALSMPRYPLEVIVATKGVLTAFGFVTTLGLRSLYSRLPDAGTSPRRILVSSVVASYLASAAWTAAYHSYFDTAASAAATFLSGEPYRLERGGSLLDGTLYYAFVLLAWSLLYVGIKHHQALQEARERALRAEAQAHQAQLRALRYQINPHFLYNSLNGVSTLVVEGRNREAASMIARLGEFLRLTLDGGGPAEVPLAKEIDFVRRYLEIERLRFGDRLRVRIRVDDRALALHVPVLILQPLAENAVRYAVSPREEGGEIAVEAKRLGDELRLEVADDGPGLAAMHASPGNGVGLPNTRARLRQLYGEAGHMELREADGGGLRVRIRIPVRAPSSAPALREGPGPHP